MSYKPEHFEKPSCINLSLDAKRNTNFRKALWTGGYMQITLMCIPVCGEIGAEIHPETDQILRVESGQGLLFVGKCKEELDFLCRLCEGDIVAVPAGVWHNLRNNGSSPLKLSSFYGPPHHPRNTLQKTASDAT